MLYVNFAVYINVCIVLNKKNPVIFTTSLDHFTLTY